MIAFSYVCLVSEKKLILKEKEDEARKSLRASAQSLNELEFFRARLRLPLEYNLKTKILKVYFAPVTIYI